MIISREEVGKAKQGIAIIRYLAITGTGMVHLSPNDIIPPDGILGRASVVEERCVSPHERDRELLEKPLNCDTFIFTSLTSESASELGHLSCCRFVPST